ARGRTRTGTASRPRDFKSLVSTDFTTRAPLRSVLARQPGAGASRRPVFRLAFDSLPATGRPFASSAVLATQPEDPMKRDPNAFAERRRVVGLGLLVLASGGLAACTTSGPTGSATAVAKRNEIDAE